MVFLRSYVHDATFETSDVRLTGNAVRIRMSRDRWELYKALGELESIATTLTVRPVLSLKWRSKPKIATEFLIRDIYLGESFWDNSDKEEVVLSGFGKNSPQLRIVAREPFSIRLQDVRKKK